MGNKKSIKSLRRKGRLKSELAHKFKTSYGAWTQIAIFMTCVAFLKLQLLDKYNYRVAIARV